MDVNIIFMANVIESARVLKTEFFSRRLEVEISEPLRVLRKLVTCANAEVNEIVELNDSVESQPGVLMSIDVSIVV